MSTLWQQEPGNEYYWTGPGAWTICKVRTGATTQFELWNGPAKGGGCAVAREATLELAQQVFEKSYAHTINQEETVSDIE